VSPSLRVIPSTTGYSEVSSVKYCCPSSESRYSTMLGRSGRLRGSLEDAGAGHVDEGAGVVAVEEVDLAVRLSSPTSSAFSYQ
jgi:hypothetical protein